MVKMAAERRTRVEHLVVDANAFIRNVNLYELGENIYTLPNVVAEIRDAATRQRLQVLPYEIKFRVPASESIKAVTDFAKKTGDYTSLSSVDLSILGLTHFLEKEVMGSVDHLNSEPKCSRPLINPRRGDVALIGGVEVSIPAISQAAATAPHQDETDNPKEPGPARLVDGAKSKDDENDEGHETEDEEALHDEVLKKIDHLSVGEKQRIVDESELSGDVETESAGDEADIVHSEENHENDDEVDVADDDDEDGWITSDNIQQVKQTMDLGGISSCEIEEMPRVACITADFSMQNVLIQMGLHCLSMDGMCIRRARTYILRCFACYKRTSDMSTIFCPACGNKGTLKKVAVELDENGELKMFINYKRPINQRGLRYPLPQFKGGKHANNPILNVYQPRPQHKLPKKALMKINALDPDFIAQEGPFAKNDVQSRAAMLGVRQIGGLRHGLDRDPYMNRVRTGNKKRRNRVQ